VPEACLTTLTEAAARDQRAGVEMPQLVGVDVQRNRVDVETSLGRVIIAPWL
jgi:hypothetical protein